MRLRLHMLRILFSLVVLTGMAYSASGPVLFYSDLPGGMCRGGQNNRGHIVTIHGKNFGAAQDISHYVSIAGAQAGGYLLWQDNKIAFQLGCSLADGDYSISVTTPAGNSNKLPFHIYSGAKIYFMDTSKGSDSNPGTYAAPFGTNIKCRTMATAAPGNTCYIMPGSWDKTSIDGASSIFIKTAHGTSDKYMGIVGYPTADSNLIPKIGCANKADGCVGGIAAIRASFSSYFVLANLKVMVIGGYYEAIDLGNQTEGNQVHHARTIDLDISGPDQPFTLLYTIGDASFISAYGIYIHDVSSSTTSRSSGGFYIGDASHDIDIGWANLDDSCILSIGLPYEQTF